MNDTDIMRRLAGARPAHLDGGGPVDPETRAAELDRAFSGPRDRHRRGSRPWLFASAAVTGMAAATAMVLVAGAGGAGPGPRRPPARTPVPLDVRNTILLAADRAERQPTGRYWFTDQIQGQSYVVRKGGYAITGAHSETFEWTSVRRGGGNLFYGRDLPARPLTKDDAAAWRRAGSPSRFRVWSNDHYETYTTRPAGPWQADPGQARAGGTFMVPGAGRQMTAAELQNLPTDPAALAKLFLTRPVIFARPKRPGPQTAYRAAMQAWMWDPAHVVLNAGDLLANAPLPPKVRAGLMRALVAQPGVRNLGTVTDPLGRRAVAIGAEWSAGRPDYGKDGKPGWVAFGHIDREELMFDPKTGDYLGDQKVLVKPGGEYRDRHPGFVIDYWLERRSGWTDAKPTPPSRPPFS